MNWLSDWRILLAIISGCSFLFSVFNLIVGRHVINKITQNDLVHLTEDVKELKTSEKDYKIDLKKDLNKIFNRLGKIEKIQYAQQKICDERHSK